MNDGGKGSKPRPYSVPLDTFWDNFDRIFGEGKYAREPEATDGRTLDGGDDVRTKTEGSDVPAPGKSGS